MRESVLHSIDLAEAHLREMRFRQCLNVLGEIDVRSISPEERAHFYLIWVEAQLSLGNSDIVSHLQNVLEFYRTSHDDEKFARAKYLKGNYLVFTGRVFDAKEPLLEALISLKRLDITARQGMILNKLSYISYHVGEFDSAIAYLKQSIDAYNKTDDSTNAMLVSLNLGQLNTKLGRLTEAIRIFNTIISEAAIKGERNKARYLIMRSMPLALKGDIPESIRIIKGAEAFLDGLLMDKAIYFEYFGWIHNLEENYGQALSTLQQGLEISLDIAPESALISQTKRLMADAYFGLGQFDAARKFADEALAVAEKLNERVEIAACHRVYARLEASTGNADAARDRFRKATDMFSMIGSRYELALTRYLAAATGIHPDGERHALLYLAREYFESENIYHLAERIDLESVHPTRKSTHSGRPAASMPMIICRNKSMKRVIELAEHVAPSGMSVLLTGATGTGKDLLARYIHHHSGRSGRFVSVNAAAIPNDMIESELFGYRRGAYTGAATTTSGWIEESEGGTFYLNEIADSSPELQAKLLDVIENRRVCRLGERQEREINCRFIAATNHPLEQLIEEGRFRLDLYHRLNEIPIHLPPLSERREDIELLLGHFLNAAGVRIITDADRNAFAQLARVFRGRPWQGNIRQLETETKRLALVCRGDISRMVNMAGTYQLSTKEETLAALQRAGWNRREVGRILGISESTVRHRIKIYNLSAE